MDSSKNKPLEKWCYLVGAASLVPFAGVLFACVAAVLGLVKIERRKGWTLLVLAFLGFALNAFWIAHYEETFFNGPPAFLPPVSGPAGEGPRQEGGGLVWLRPAEGLKESARTRKPILYDFTAEWCGFCKLMDAKVFEKADDAAKIRDRFVTVVVMDRRREEGKNPADIAELQSRYQIRGFPTLVVQYPGRGGSRQMAGFLGEDQVMAFLTAKP